MTAMRFVARGCATAVFGSNIPSAPGCMFSLVIRSAVKRYSFVGAPPLTAARPHSLPAYRRSAITLAVNWRAAFSLSARQIARSRLVTTACSALGNLAITINVL